MSKKDKESDDFSDIQKVTSISSLTAEQIEYSDSIKEYFWKSAVKGEILPDKFNGFRGTVICSKDVMFKMNFGKVYREKVQISKNDPKEFDEKIIMKLILREVQEHSESTRSITQQFVKLEPSTKESQPFYFAIISSKTPVIEEEDRKEGVLRL